MLLSLIIIVALIWAAVIGTIYSNFLVFYSNFAETENYNKAYYASIAALERAELTTKQRQPWFEWGWWRYWSYTLGWESDWPIESNFSYLSRDSGIDSISRWEVSSLTNRIPNPERWWNVDRTLSTGDSINYNMMDYNNSEIITLYRDPISTNNPYQKIEKSDMIKAKENGIDIQIRLPGYLRDTFWNLNSNSGLVNNVKDDAIVDRQVMWKYNDQQFTIFATQNTTLAWNILDGDTAIRESTINNNANLRFGDPSQPQNPLDNEWDEPWTIISPNSSEIYDFKQILENNSDEFSQVQIRLSLLNLLKNSNWAIYPFLEYQVSFPDDPAPDKYFTITAEWNYKDYQVRLNIQKPTKQESILQSFTTIF